ncbi:ABC transporter permease [Bdellovibrio svalbardensis]|uniref:ABC transporter permease n=1 Tax=Bdellovibrio svalbardensis TaxID=2972972 RepID=A0ABT6DL50_9BACT|nr:ABC transporter permease [Bdellovibrio svalbardensis]MDG0817598.1 ABC transporter permease [Bdellovibrio svalbardensis]
MAHERSRPAAPLSAKILLWVVLALLYLPIAVMLMGSFLEVKEGQVSATLHWFVEVFADDNLMGALKNSLLVGLFSSVLSTLLGTAAAVGLYRSSSRLRGVMEGLSMVSLIFPEIVFALSLLSWFFVLKMEMGLQTVIIAHVSFSLSYVMMTVNSRLVTLDSSLEDAARDLGAGEWTVLRTVILPLLKPAIVGGFILSFLLSFDDFLITYFVNGVGQDTLPVKLYTAMKMGVSPKLNALSSLMFLMTLFVLIFLFRSPSFYVLFGESKKSRDGNGSKEKENL